MTFSLTNQISADQNVSRLKAYFDLSLRFFRLSLKRQKTEHNEIKVACTKHFDWLVKFPAVEFVKTVCTCTITGSLSDVYTIV